ncbi:inhibitor of Bruton tyrosine kinase-like [Condylostylus longicornis]|uniref:inhibitor of Bruton tyrosine kinase-like n=1 Tax=Condylostylus longicornis TaxID=2530218 RepID=UPI00244E3BBC|nr:inhibitor of Bruton tyrosine kinase-like [Condylostylus longicornis]
MSAKVLEDSLEHDCTKICRKACHGQKITSALTKISIEDHILAVYISLICQNFANNRDYLGRTGLHIAAATGKYILCKWLLDNRASINSRDYESGNTALHRAIFYGHIDCAVLLIKYGARMDILDKDMYQPFQDICKIEKGLGSDTTNIKELLVWGDKSYNFGFRNNYSPKTPTNLDPFVKDNVSINSVALSSFHSMFLDQKGALYAAGLGAWGRLGNGSENDLIVPSKVTIKMKYSEEKILKISISKYHSMVLSNKGLVYVCGSNKYNQLGLERPLDKVSTFQQVPFFQFGIDKIVGILAKNYFSIAYTKICFHVWGRNLGQSQFDKSIDLSPRMNFKPPDGEEIEYVEASNFAIAVATARKNIYLYHNCEVRTIILPLNLIPRYWQTKNGSQYIKHVSIIHSEFDGNSSPRLLLVSEKNTLYVWNKSSEDFEECFFSPFKLSIIDKIIFKLNEVFIMSQGKVYMGKCKNIPIATEICGDYPLVLFKTTYKIQIELNCINFIDNAIDIYCDERFESFAVLHDFYVFPKLSEEFNFKKLFDEINQYDAINDLIFHVDNEIFYAHKFIVYFRSKGLKEIIEQFDDENIYLNYKGLTAKMFHTILKHIYCHYFPTLDEIRDFIDERLESSCNQNQLKHLDILLDVAEKFTLMDLVSHIKSQINLNPNGELVDNDTSQFGRMKISNFPELYDVKIKCADNEELQAHKCVLVERLEYFHARFTHGWDESAVVDLTNVPIKYFQPILDFVYDNDIENFKNQNYDEIFLYNIIVICDIFLIDSLSILCISLLFQKNGIEKCGEMLEFAVSYNCGILKKYCMDFICLHLSSVLFRRSLEVCKLETLKLLNIYYKQIFKNIFASRVIAVDSEAPSDEDISNSANNSTVNIEDKDNEKILTEKQFKEKDKRVERLKDNRRKYEQTAILAKIEELRMENKKNLQHQFKQSENEEINSSLEINNSKIWTKINRKEKKTKCVMESIATSKEKTEKEQNLVRLNKVVNLSTKSTNKKNSNILNVEKMDSTETSIPRNSQFGDFIPKTFFRMSQKQRKVFEESNKGKLKEKIDKPFEKQNAWKVITPPKNDCFDLFLKTEERKHKKSLKK